MAEVTSVLREVQLNTEGELVFVPARGSAPLYSSRRSKVVKDDSAAVGATKADRKMAVARNKDVGTFVGEIGATKAKLANKKAAGTSMVKAASWSDFAVTKADAGNKEAAGSITGEIGVAKADAGNKEVAGSFIGEIGVTKAGAGNKEVAVNFIGEIGVTKAEDAAGSFTGEIGVAKAEPGNKEVAGSFTSELGVAKADAGNKEVAGCITGVIDVIKAEEEAPGKGVVTEVDWIQFVFPKPPVELLERKAEPTGAMIAKERVPEVIIDRLKLKRPFKKLPPVDDDMSDLYIIFPELRESYISHMAWWNYLVDLHVDVLEQDKEKGFAEVGVDFTDGDKKIFILPKDQRCAGCAA